MSEERIFNIITSYDQSSNGVVSLPIRPNQGSQYGSPGLSGKELQARFDKLASVIIDKYNVMAKALSSTEALEYFKLPSGMDLPEDAPNNLSKLIGLITDAQGYLMAIEPETQEAERVNDILAKLFDDIVQEATERAEEDIRLEQLIVAETEARQAEDQALQKAIDLETQARISEDNALNAALESEVNARKNADKALEDRIETEKSDRISADNVLQGRIDTEASIRASADTSLSQKIADETAARKRGDETLSAMHIALSDTVNDIKAVVDDFFSTISDGDSDPIDRLVEIVNFLNENRTIIELLRNDKIDKAQIVKTKDELAKATDANVPSAKFLNEYFVSTDEVLEFVTEDELDKALEPYITKTEASEIYIDSTALHNALAPYIKAEEAKKYIDSEELNAALSALDAASSWHFLDTSYSATETNIDSWMNRTDYWNVKKDASNVRVGDLVLFKCYNLTRQTPSYVLAKAIPKDAGNTSGANVIKAYSTSVIHTEQKSTEVEGVDPETKELLDDIYHTNGTVGLEYDIGSKSATLVRVDGYVDEREIEVATIVKGIPVTVISNNVFNSPANAKVEAVIIPHTITAILGNAFANVENLKAVYYIGDVNGWNSIDIGVGNDAVLNANIFFMYDMALTASSVWGVFGAKSIAEIPAYFRGLPVRIIGNVKYDASSSEASFKMATNVTEVVIPDTVTELIEYAFYGYSKLRSVRIGSGLKKISKSAFMGTGLLDLALPDGLVGIGASAFRQCSDLQNVFIPKSVTYIGTLAFSECIRLSSIRYEGSEEEWNNIEKEANWAGSNVPTILFNQGG